MNFNSFYGVTTPLEENGYEVYGGYLDASQNYWHGLSVADIRETIRDSTVYVASTGTMEILPMLTEPHPDTPDCSQG